MIVKINGTTIKSPPDWDIERYNITKAERVATGDMSIELIAKKRKFLLGYSSLSGEEFDFIVALVDGEEMLMDLTYEHNGSLLNAVVYCGPIKARKHRSNGGWVWKNVTFNLIER